MTRMPVGRSAFLVVALAAGSALADQPVVVDRDSVLSQLQNLSTSLANLQQHAQVVATQPHNSQPSRASVAQLQSGLQQVSQQLNALNEQVKHAGGPAIAACPPCPACNQQVAVCPPPPDCAQYPPRGRGRHGEMMCPPPPACPPPVVCPQCPPPVVVTQGPGPGRDRDRERREHEEHERWRREHGGQQPPPPPAGPVPIDEGSLQQLLGAVGAEAFSEDKLRVLGDGGSSQYFTVDQTIRVIGAFTFSQDKLNALRSVAPRILDRQNQFKIYGAFTFSSEKAEAKQILEGR